MELEEFGLVLNMAIGRLGMTFGLEAVPVRLPAYWFEKLVDMTFLIVLILPEHSQVAVRYL